MNRGFRQHQRDFLAKGPRERYLHVLPRYARRDRLGFPATGRRDRRRLDGRVVGSQLRGTSSRTFGFDHQLIRTRRRELHGIHEFVAVKMPVAKQKPFRCIPFQVVPSRERAFACFQRHFLARCHRY